MDTVDVTIIGGGVVGLAIAADVSRAYNDVVLLERHADIGQETSSRNSGVIHAGIYYPPGSFKASMCVEGARLLYNYCKRNSIAHSRIGKLVVAVSQSETSELTELYQNARENGVEGLRVLQGNDIRKMEPNVSARSALYSPDTGIIDVHSLMLSLYNESLSSGVVFSFNAEAGFIGHEDDLYVIGVKDYRFLSRIVINSAGLSSDRVASLVGIDVDREGYRLDYVKGSYFYYMKRSPVNHLVYPLPVRDGVGLGIHATLDLHGRLRFGPDSERVSSMDYRVDSRKKDVFYDSVSRYLSTLDKEAFSPDMAGIRPAIRRGSGDFIIRHEIDRGLKGFVNLIGIDSPGLTASLAIARHVRKLLNEM